MIITITISDSETEDIDCSDEKVSAKFETTENISGYTQQQQRPKELWEVIDDLELVCLAIDQMVKLGSCLRVMKVKKYSAVKIT